MRENKMAKKATKEQRCDHCGKTGARVISTSRAYGKGKDIMVIHNIPVIVCSHCGESYLEAKTLYEVERLKRHRRTLATLRPVPVATLT